MMREQKEFQIAMSSHTQHVALIYNAVNHDSLVAAALMTLLLETKTEMTIDLIDIRDSIPDQADSYVWLDCGSAEAFKKYYTQALVKHADPAGHRAWCERVLGRSLRIDPMQVREQDPSETTVGRMLGLLKEAELVDGDTYRRLMSLAALSHRFHSESASSEDVVQYYDILSMALGITLGRKHSLFTILSALEWKPDVVALETFKVRQKSINRRLASKYREIDVGGRRMHHVTMTGYEVFGLIRRLAIAKKPFVHVSMGAYGQVLYSSTPIANVYVAECGLLNLTPETEVSKAV